MIRNRLPTLLSFGLLTLLLVWFLPHTSGLRYGLVVLLLFGAFMVPTVRQTLRRLWYFPPVWGLLLLSLWLLLQLFWAWNPIETLAELKGQWLKSGVMLLTGAAVAAALQPRSGQSFPALRRLSEALTLIMLLQLADYARLWWTQGILPRDAVGLFGFKTELSYLANLLFAMCLAEGFSRLCQLRSVLPVSRLQLVISTLAAITLLVVAGARNGMIGMALLLLSTAILALFVLPPAIRQRVKFWPLLVVLAVPLIGFLSWKLDPRWQRLAETLPYAVNSAAHPSWLDSERYPWPRLSDGDLVEISAYERVAFLTEGLRLSWQYPEGIGFTRKAFSHAVEAKFGLPSRHAHSGMVEWLLAMGWLGFALWCAVLLWLIQRGFHLLLRRGSGLGLLLVCVVSGFASRMLIENITRDLTFEWFMLQLGILWICVLHEEQKTSF